jgi:hypothetical protein
MGSRVSRGTTPSMATRHLTHRAAHKPKLRNKVTISPMTLTWKYE